MSGYIPKTDLESLIIKNPNKEFLDYSLLSLNPQITWEFKLTFLNLVHSNKNRKYKEIH